MEVQRQMRDLSAAEYELIPSAGVSVCPSLGVMRLKGKPWMRTLSVKDVAGFLEQLLWAWCCFTPGWRSSVFSSINHSFFLLFLSKDQLLASFSVSWSYAIRTPPFFFLPSLCVYLFCHTCPRWAFRRTPASVGFLSRGLGGVDLCACSLVDPHKCMMRCSPCQPLATSRMLLSTLRSVAAAGPWALQMASGFSQPLHWESDFPYCVWSLAISLESTD